MTNVLTAKEILATYGELPLVELHAISCFASLGWETANLYNEAFGPSGTEGRTSAAEVILVPRLRKALERINPGYPATAYDQAIEQLTEDRSTQIHHAQNMRRRVGQRRRGRPSPNLADRHDVDRIGLVANADRDQLGAGRRYA